MNCNRDKLCVPKVLPGNAVQEKIDGEPDQKECCSDVLHHYNGRCFLSFCLIEIERYIYYNSLWHG